MPCRGAWCATSSVQLDDTPLTTRVLIQSSSSNSMTESERDHETSHTSRDTPETGSAGHDAQLSRPERTPQPNRLGRLCAVAVWKPRGGSAGAVAHTVHVEDDDGASFEADEAAGGEVGQCLVHGLTGSTDELSQLFLGEVVSDEHTVGSRL